MYPPSSPTVIGGPGSGEASISRWHPASYMNCSGPMSSSSREPVLSATDIKSVEVHVFPTEGDLQYLVNSRDTGITRHQQPSPNERTHAAQHNAQLKNYPL
jgi:hypothetical protein